MFKTNLITLTAIAAFSLNTAAVAGADCPEAPKSEWLSELDMQKKIINNYGFTIHKFKVDDNCYEIYGMAPESDAEDAKSVKAEIYFNPVNGEIVKKKLKD